MSRWPPSISRIYAQDDGLRVEWELEKWVSGAEEPDEVYVETPSGTSQDLGGRARSYDIPARVVESMRSAGVQEMPVSVIFRWRGPPDDVKASGLAYPIGGTPELRARKPTVGDTEEDS